MPRTALAFAHSCSMICLLGPAHSVSDAEGRELPWLGRVAAGEPIEALGADEGLAVPSHLMRGKVGEHFVLRVAGESMIDEGIRDGDFVVIERRERAEVGEMVVALIGEDVTLKRYFPEGEQVRLEPSNPAMEAIVVAAADLRLQGVVVGLMRRY